MQLIEIDPIGREAAETVVDRLPHVRGTGTLARVVDRQAEFRREDHRLAAPRQRAPDELLALGTAVDVGGVEEVDAGVERGMHDGFRALVVQAHTEVVAAEPGHADRQ